MYSVDDFLQRAATQLKAYENEGSNLQSLITQNQQRRAELQQRLNDSYVNLCATVLPTPTAESLGQLSSTISAPRIAQLWTEMQRRQQQLQSEIREVEADDEYQKRSALTMPHTGVLSSQIEEIEPMYARLQQELDHMNAMPRLQHLIASGYGTSRYPHTGFLRFFNSEYLQDWKAGDSILEQLGASSFLDVAARYSELRNQTKTLSDSLTDLRAQLQRVQSKVQEHDRDVDELAHLLDALRLEVGRELAVFVQARKEAAAASLPNGEEALKLYAVIDGMKHQIEYLDQLMVKISGDVSDLNQRADKLRMEKARYEGDRHRFRNKSFTNEQFAHRFGNERYSRAYNRYNRMGETIYVFNDYYRPSLFQEFLWWDVMTDGRLDGNFIPEVSSYYNAHPDYDYERDTSSNDSDSQSGGWSDVS